MYQKVSATEEKEILRAEFVLYALAGQYQGITPDDDAQPTVQRVLAALRDAVQYGHPFGPAELDSVDIIFSLLLAGRENPRFLPSWTAMERKPAPGAAVSVMVHDLHLEAILWISHDEIDGYGEEISYCIDLQRWRLSLASRYPLTWKLLLQHD